MHITGDAQHGPGDDAQAWGVRTGKTVLILHAPLCEPVRYVQPQPKKVALTLRLVGRKTSFAQLQVGRSPARSLFRDVLLRSEPRKRFYLTRLCSQIEVFCSMIKLVNSTSFDSLRHDPFGERGFWCDANSPEAIAADEMTASVF